MSVNAGRFRYLEEEPGAPTPTLEERIDRKIEERIAGMVEERIDRKIGDVTGRINDIERDSREAVGACKEVVHMVLKRLQDLSGILDQSVQNRARHLFAGEPTTMPPENEQEGPTGRDNLSPHVERDQYNCRPLMAKVMVRRYYATNAMPAGTGQYDTLEVREPGEHAVHHLTQILLDMRSELMSAVDELSTVRWKVQ